MIRRIVGAGGILAVAVVVVACSSAPTPAPTAPASLAGTSWTLGLQGGTAPAARQPPTVVFGTDGLVSGFTGCDPYAGTFTENGASLTFIGLARTPSSNQCAPDVEAAAAAFVAALGGVNRWGTEVVAPTQGVKVLAPVKLLLAGPTPLVFTLQ